MARQLSFVQLSGLGAGRPRPVEKDSYAGKGDGREAQDRRRRLGPKALLARARDFDSDGPGKECRGLSSWRGKAAQFFFSRSAKKGENEMEA